MALRLALFSLALLAPGLAAAHPDEEAGAPHVHWAGGSLTLAAIVLVAVMVLAGLVALSLRRKPETPRLEEIT